MAKRTQFRRGHSAKKKTVAETKQSGEARVLDSSSSSSSSGIRPAQTDAVAMTWQLGETK